jgi:hypothetical protein
MLDASRNNRKEKHSSWQAARELTLRLNDLTKQHISSTSRPAPNSTPSRSQRAELLPPR